MQLESYDLFLDVDFKNLKFDGKLLVEMESKGDVQLDSVGLEILSVTSNGRPLKHSLANDQLSVSTGPFSGKLEIEYRGKVNENLVGLYKAPYGDSYLLTTQFEAASARRLLPCIDHPAHKAEFKLAVRTDPELSVISNMPVEWARQEGSGKTTTFQRTPRMSTYLLYLGIGKFDEARDKASIIIMATTPGNADKTGFARDVAKKSVEFYESYFGSPYQLPKLHLLGVPEFAEGAMENWGAITFREAYLLVDENSSVRTKKTVANVTAHEVAHQWFGNLVTMEWWDDLWLNESFATFMAGKVVDSLFPNWRVWQDFVRVDTSSAMSRDSLESTHPIQARISHPSEIDQLFDQISYGKGASIIRMIEAYTGPENFKAGVRSYLEQHKFSNATGTELWNSLETTSGTQVKRIMSDWITKPGYPVVTVGLSGRRLSLKQKRFLLSGVPEETTWPIPITMEIDGKNRRVLLEKVEENIELAESPTSLRVNLDRTGFYRVNYEGLYPMVWKSQPSAMDRFGIVSDALSFTLAGSLGFQDYLSLVSRFHEEQEYLPAFETSDQLAFLYSLTPKIAETSKTFHRSQLQTLTRRKDENSILLRGAIASRLALVDPEYAKTLSEQFRKYETVEPDMRQAVATAYARAREDFDGLVKTYKECASDEEKVRLLVALVSFRRSASLARSFELATSSEVRKQNVPILLISCLRNPDARDPAWQWLKANLEWLNKLFEGSGNISRLLQETIPFVGIGRQSEVENFFKENRFPGLEKGIDAGLEKLRICNKFLQNLESPSKQVAPVVLGSV